MDAVHCSSHGSTCLLCAGHSCLDLPLRYNPLPQVNEAFEELEDGNDEALKLVLERQKTQLRCAVRPRCRGSIHAYQRCSTL